MNGDEARPGPGDHEPDDHAGADPKREMLDLLAAFHHPVRRMLCEVLALIGPATVGHLAKRTGMAPGSVSHHLKPLARHGLLEQAPEQGHDGRETWWQLSRRDLAWALEDYPSGTTARRMADLAMMETVKYQMRSIRQWMNDADQLPEDWLSATAINDLLVLATPEQMGDLDDRLGALLAEWRQECREDARRRPEAHRRPVRVIADAFISAPLKPPAR